MSAPRIDHIGIIVHDLDQAIERFAVLLGGLAPQRRDLADVGLRVAEFHAANLTIELIAYAGPAEFARRVMGSEVGLNHISLAVDDLPAAMRSLSGAGLQPQDGFPRPGAHGTVAFFERDAATGLLLELCAADGVAASKRAPQGETA